MERRAAGDDPGERMVAGFAARASVKLLPPVDSRNRDHCYGDNCDQSHRSPTPGSGQGQLLFFLRNDAGPDRLLLNQHARRAMAVDGRTLSNHSHTRWSNDLHVRNKLIPPARQGDDVVVVPRLLLQRSAQCGDALRQAVLVHVGVRPDIPEQFVASKHPSRVLDEVEKHIEGPAIERDNLFFAPQGARQGINSKLSELVYPFGFHRHSDYSKLVNSCQNWSLAFFRELPQHSRAVQGETYERTLPMAKRTGKPLPFGPVG